MHLRPPARPRACHLLLRSRNSLDGKSKRSSTRNVCYWARMTPHTVFAFLAYWMDGMESMRHDSALRGDQHAHDATDYPFPFATNTIVRCVGTVRRTQSTLQAARSEHESERATPERLSRRQSDGQSSRDFARRCARYRAGRHWHLSCRPLPGSGHHTGDWRRVTWTIFTLVRLLRRML